MSEMPLSCQTVDHFFETETLMFRPDLEQIDEKIDFSELVQVPLAVGAWTKSDYICAENRFLSACQRLSEKECDLTQAKDFESLLAMEAARLYARQEQKIRQNLKKLFTQEKNFVTTLGEGQFLNHSNVLLAEMTSHGHIEIAGQLELLLEDEAFWEALSAIPQETQLMQLERQIIALEPDGIAEKINLLRQLCSGSCLKLLDGPPGAGKSKVIWAVKEIWQKSVGVGQQALVLCPTITAAAELAQEIKADAASLTEFLTDATAQNAIEKGKLLILDEAGMVGTLAFSQLCHIAEQAGATLLIVGDRLQSLPLCAGHPFRYLSHSFPISSLTRSLRQKRQCHRDMIQYMRQGDLQKALQILNHRNMFSCVPKQSMEAQSFAELWELMVERSLSFRDFVLIALSTKQAQVLNDRFHDFLCQQAVLKEGVAATKFYLGERIRLKESVETAEGEILPAGAVFLIDAVEAEQIELSPFDRKQRSVLIPITKLEVCEYAYVLDAVSAQGIAINYVWLLLEEIPTLDVLMNVLTRHKLDLKVYISEEKAKSYRHFAAKVSTRQKAMLLDFVSPQILKKLQIAVVQK